VRGRFWVRASHDKWRKWVSRNHDVMPAKAGVHIGMATKSMVGLAEESVLAVHLGHSTIGLMALGPIAPLERFCREAAGPKY
jgi:hypothetical protein